MEHCLLPPNFNLEAALDQTDDPQIRRSLIEQAYATIVGADILQAAVELTVVDVA